MRHWSATRAGRVLAALLRIGWRVKRQSDSDRTLARDGWPGYVFAFHDGEAIGPRMLGADREEDGAAARRPVV